MFLVLLSFRYVICRPQGLPILAGWKVALRVSIFITALGSRAFKEIGWKCCCQSVFLNIFTVNEITWLTSCLLKYFKAPSLSDRMNFRLKNWPLSRPRFHRNPSLYPEWKRDKGREMSMPVSVCVRVVGWRLPSKTRQIKQEIKLRWHLPR